MLTVAVDAHILTGIPQGSRTYLDNVLRRLGGLDRENRYQIFSFDPAATRKALDFANFEHHRLAVPAAIPRLLLYWPYAKLRYRFDVLITQYILPPFVPGPLFVVTHDILPETHPHLFPFFMRWRSRLLFRLSARRARDVFVVSQYTRRELIARYRVAPAKVHVTYNGFDAAAFGRAAPTEPGERGDYVLYVGRLEPRKNVDLIIAAVEAIAPPIRLVIVGRQDGADPALRALIRRSPRVEHRDEVDADVLDRLYRNALALVYPSQAEGFGLPILEALARNTPVIASDRTALPEVGGAFARYLDPTAADARAQLAWLIDEVRRKPAAPDPAALAAHVGKFDWERSARTILERLDVLAASRASARQRG